jgi:hypothetical protein
MKKKEIEWEDDSKEILEWEIDYVEKSSKKMEKPKYTKLNSGEKIIKTIIDTSSDLAKTFGFATDVVRRPTVGEDIHDGDFFITNQRLIFEGHDKQYEDFLDVFNILDDTIPHTIVRKIGGTDGDMFSASHIWINYDDQIELLKNDPSKRYNVFYLPHGEEWAKWLNNRFYTVDAKAKRARNQALDCERHLDYKGAINIYEKHHMPEEASRVRRIMYDEKKVDQTVVHGDYIDDRDTIVKDSVISKSNIGAGGKSKAKEIKEIKELLDSDAIDDAEFKQMKKEILGK